jgi:hypothetical protein
MAFLFDPHPISELICLKKAIPINEWYHTLQAQNSIKSVVNFQKDKLIVNGKCIDPSQLSNKYLYNEYINVKFLKPIGINTWLKIKSLFIQLSNIKLLFLNIINLFPHILKAVF